MSEGDRYYIRALDRALAVLRVLNQYNGLNASELSRAVGLPRPTVMRFLTTLANCGYVERSDFDERYRVTPEVRHLTYGYREEHWLASVVNPFLEKLHRQLGYELAFLSLHNGRLIIESLSNRISAMIERRESSGAELPLLSSASGYLLIALTDNETRERLIARAVEGETSMVTPGGVAVEWVRQKIEEARRNQWVALTVDGQTVISVPVWVKGAVAGALAIRIKCVDAEDDQRAVYFKDVLQRHAEHLGQMIEIDQTSSASYSRPQMEQGREVVPY